jgi:hypothetical protein
VQKEERGIAPSERTALFYLNICAVFFHEKTGGQYDVKKTLREWEEYPHSLNH